MRFANDCNADRARRNGHMVRCAFSLCGFSSQRISSLHLERFFESPAGGLTPVTSLHA